MKLDSTRLLRLSETTRTSVELPSKKTCLTSTVASRSPPLASATPTGKLGFCLEILSLATSNFLCRPGGLFNKKEKAKWDAWDKWTKVEELAEDQNKAKEKYCELVSNIIPESDW